MNISLLKNLSSRELIYGVYPDKDEKDLSREFEEMGDV